MRNTLITFILLALSRIIFAKPSQDWDVGIENRTIDQIYQAALNESGLLTVGWGGDIKPWQDLIIDSFHNRFPDIKLNLTGDLSKYWDSKIDMAFQVSECKDNNVDVAVLQTLHDFPRWKAEGRLMQYKVAPWNDIYPEFVDPDGTYTGLFTASFGTIIYNPKAINQSSIPRTIANFLSPEYANGMMSLTYPNDDDAMLYLFSRITEKYGWGFIHSLVQQNVTWVRGSATSSLLIDKAYKSNDSNPSPVISFATVGAFTPELPNAATDDVYITWPQTGAIFSTTKYPETAKLFLSYLMDDDWQKMLSGGGFATRKTYDSRGVFKQEPNMDALGFIRFMEDRKVVEHWRFQFETILGLPQGENPNYIDV